MADEQQSLKRNMVKTYSVIYAFILFAFIAVLFNVVKITIFNGEEYRKLGKRAKNDSTRVEANRGNIFDCNGKLLASTIPSYQLHWDMRQDGLTRDTFQKYLDSVSLCLSHIYGTASPREFKQRLIGAFNRGDRYFLVDKKKLDYTQYKQVEGFPLLRKGSKSGRVWDQSIKREHPFGDLGRRTIGGLDHEGMGNSGLEMAFNRQLAGKPGVSTKEKKGGRWLNVNCIDPIDGNDVVSTIDIDIQDIAEEALRKYVVERQPEWGCAVVMEVHTGEIKAIANLSRGSDSAYTEVQNFALSAMTEPGSTFKTASVMAALDDGLTDTSEVFDTEHGFWRYSNNDADRPVTDHNVKYNADRTFSNEGGFGKITLAEAMWQSSNIGIAKMVDKYYGKNPRRFVNRLYDLRLKDSLDIVIPGAPAPTFKDPSMKDWTPSTLLWMSFGYNVQIPPIYTLTFYNGIANNGKMISPVFAKAVCENGTPIKTFGTHTVKSRLCSESTLRKVRSMLEGVVTKGTGRAFKSEKVTFAGKTGTAQTNYWDKKVRQGHQITFCGYFPADKPQYSCIVVLFKPTYGGPNPAGLTFREIAEHVSARKLDVVGNDGRTKNVKLPPSFKGHRQSLETVYKRLNIPYTVPDEGGDQEWANPSANEGARRVNLSTYNASAHTVPNVVGMGAKDAVYLIEQCGMKARVHGYGDVVQQSASPGSAIAPGATIDLKMRHNN